MIQLCKNLNVTADKMSNNGGTRLRGHREALLFHSGLLTYKTSTSFHPSSLIYKARVKKNTILQFMCSIFHFLYELLPIISPMCFLLSADILHMVFMVDSS